MLRNKLLVLFLLTIFATKAQNWTLKDIGVGLIVEDENYAKSLSIVKRATNWDIKDLYDNGAMAGKYKGNQLFAAWIQGPPSSEYKNSYGTPVWLYKYKITSPDGKSFEAGPYGFYESGFAYFGIKSGNYAVGKWTVDFYIWHRDTNETRHVGTTEFTTFEGK